jgi:hypothetical protein
MEGPVPQPAHPTVEQTLVMIRSELICFMRKSNKA